MTLPTPEQTPVSNSNPAERSEDIYPILAIGVYPGMTSDLLLGAANNIKAIVLETNAMGSVSQRLYPALRNLWERNVPVFILSDNAGAYHGVIRIVEESQRATERNGGIFLEKANIEIEQQVIKAIKDALDAGKTGPELGETIRKQFSYQEGEEKPISRLGATEGFNKYLEEIEEELK